MTASVAKKEPMKRVNTRVLESHDDFVKAEVKRSKGALTEGDVYRMLLEEAITARKAQA